MKLAEHADACRQELGKPFFEIHEFIDQYAQDFGGFAHRRLLHHRLGVKLVLERFGDEAAGAAELHIKQDTNGVVPEDWADYGEPILLHLEDYDRQDQILRGLYGDEIFTAVQAKL